MCDLMELVLVQSGIYSVPCGRAHHVLELYGLCEEELRM